MITAAKSFWFCAGHRLKDHESKCKHLHGHNWRVTVHVMAYELDKCGRVVDFSFIKDSVKGWVDVNLDHGMILQKDDTDAIKALQRLPGAKLYVICRPPTAENIAMLILSVAKALMPVGVEVTQVDIEETDGSVATCTA